MTMKFLYEDEETIHVYVNDKSVGSLTHDNLGWSGMDICQSILNQVAKELNLEVVIEYDKENYESYE